MLRLGIRKQVGDMYSDTMEDMHTFEQALHRVVTQCKTCDEGFSTYYL